MNPEMSESRVWFHSTLLAARLHTRTILLLVVVPAVVLIPAAIAPEMFALVGQAQCYSNSINCAPWVLPYGIVMILLIVLGSAYLWINPVVFVVALFRRKWAAAICAVLGFAVLLAETFVFIDRIQIN